MIVLFPIVRPERGGREVGGVVKIAVRVIQPRIANGDWRGEVRAADDNLIAINLRFSGFPLLVGTGDLEALHCAAVLGPQSAIGMLEGDGDGIGAN